MQYCNAAVQELARKIVEELRSQTSPVNIAGMARFHINPDRCFGISIPQLRIMAQPYKRNQSLAEQLWRHGWRETRILATLIADPKQIKASVMEAWVRDLHSWDVCDACCLNLFDKTPHAFTKALQWSKRKREFEKRAGFALMAALAVHDKAAQDQAFLPFLAAIEREAADERNFVRKAASWALRQIGKRNKQLHGVSLQTAYRIRIIDSTAARWIAADAIRELAGSSVQSRRRTVTKMGRASAPDSLVDQQTLRRNR